MKSIVKLAGIYLASMLVVSMAITATASAAPVWEHCTKGAVSGHEPNGKTTTIRTISPEPSKNEWQWREVNNTEEVRVKGSLLLVDEKASILGGAAVECYGEGEGTVGPGKFDRINKITVEAKNVVTLKIAQQ